MQLLLGVMMTVTVLVKVTSTNSKRAPLKCGLKVLSHQPNC